MGLALRCWRLHLYQEVSSFVITTGDHGPSAPEPPLLLPAARLDRLAGYRPARQTGRSVARYGQLLGLIGFQERHWSAYQRASSAYLRGAWCENPVALPDRTPVEPAALVERIDSGSKVSSQREPSS